MSLPVWTATTAVLTGKLVSKVTTDGTAWVASVAGTTGASEPTWPTNEPWSVADGTTAWNLTTSFRTNWMDGLVTVLTNFRDANPNLLKGIRSARPKSMTNVDLPCAYIDGSDEQTTYGLQLVTRAITGLSVVIVDVTPDNIEAEDRMDVLIDGLVGAFLGAFHAIDGKSILQYSAVNSLSFEEGGIPYLAYSISLGGTFKTEGLIRG